MNTVVTVHNLHSRTHTHTHTTWMQLYGKHAKQLDSAGGQKSPNEEVLIDIQKEFKWFSLTD